MEHTRLLRDVSAAERGDRSISSMIRPVSQASESFTDDTATIELVKQMIAAIQANIASIAELSPAAVRNVPGARAKLNGLKSKSAQMITKADEELRRLQSIGRYDSRQNIVRRLQSHLESLKSHFDSLKSQVKLSSLVQDQDLIQFKEGENESDRGDYRQSSLQELALPEDIQLAEENAKIIESNAQDIDQIQKDIAQINSLFRDLQTAVGEQGLVVESIVGNMERAKEYVAGATEELRKTEASERTSMKCKKCCCWLLILVILAMIVALILHLLS